MPLLDMVPDVGDVLQKTHENNGFGPIALPRDGKGRILFADFCMIILLLFILMVYRWNESKSPLSKEDVYLISSFVFSIMTVDVIERLCMFAEEWHHVNERHGGNKMEALRVCTYSKEAFATIAVVYAVVTAFTLDAYSKGKFTYSAVLYIITATFLKLCVDMLGSKRLSRVEISELYESGEKNVAAGLAWSFYFGYLKIILPDFKKVFQKARGPGYTYDNDDICDLVEGGNRRLYIIIPKDGYCRRKFEELDERITMVGQMPEQVKSRGGVSQRPYKNTLYRIEREDEIPRFVVMEYSSNLSSMYDMTLCEKAKFTQEDRMKQINMYYNNLLDIIEKDPECAERARLILIGPASGESKLFGGKKLGDIICEKLDDDLQ